ncbi:MAG: hypothetical protein WCJ92_06005 [Alphaproteobacteria bacterium]
MKKILLMTLLATSTIINAAAKGDPEYSYQVEQKVAFLYGQEEPTSTTAHNTSSDEEELAAAPVRIETPPSLTGAPREDAVVIPAAEGSFTCTLRSENELILSLIYGPNYGESKRSMDTTFDFLDYKGAAEKELTLLNSEEFLRFIAAHNVEGMETTRLAITKAIADQLCPPTSLTELVQELVFSDRRAEGTEPRRVIGTDAQAKAVITEHFRNLERRLSESEDTSSKYWEVVSKLRTVEESLRKASAEKAQAEAAAAAAASAATSAGKGSREAAEDFTRRLQEQQSQIDANNVAFKELQAKHTVASKSADTEICRLAEELERCKSSLEYDARKFREALDVAKRHEEIAQAALYAKTAQLNDSQAATAAAHQKIETLKQLAIGYSKQVQAA